MGGQATQFYMAPPQPQDPQLDAYYRAMVRGYGSVDNKTTDNSSLDSLLRTTTPGYGGRQGVNVNWSPGESTQGAVAPQAAGAGGARYVPPKAATAAQNVQTKVWKPAAAVPGAGGGGMTGTVAPPTRPPAMPATISGGSGAIPRAAPQIYRPSPMPGQAPGPVTTQQVSGRYQFPGQVTRPAPALPPFLQQRGVTRGY
jgi:hypothetical protein